MYFTGREKEVSDGPIRPLQTRYPTQTRWVKLMLLDFLIGFKSGRQYSLRLNATLGAARNQSRATAAQSPVPGLMSPLTAV